MRFLLPLAVLVALALVALPASAQSLPDWAAPSSSSVPDPTGPGSDPGTPGTPRQEVPIDGGLGLLALAGGAYAVRRLRERG